MRGALLARPIGTQQTSDVGFDPFFSQLLGSRAVPASICPKTMTDLSSPDYAHRPAFSALVARLAATLK